MKKTRNCIAIMLIAVITFTACKKDDDNGDVNNPNNTTENVVLVLNEGAFGGTSGSISTIDKTGQIQNEVFNGINGRPLGNVLQSACYNSENIYFVLNQSSKIEITDKQFKQSGAIEGIQSPRYMTINGGKGYLTSWSDQVYVLDLSANTIIDSISVSGGPNGILSVGTDILVAQSGGFMNDSVVAVINTTSNEITKDIVVGDNPQEMVVDKNGNVWVICHGYVQYDYNTFEVVAESACELYCISGSDYSVLKQILVSDSTHASHLDIDPSGDHIYVGGGYGFNGIYKVNISDSQLNDTAFVSGKQFYGFNVDPSTGDIYAGDAGDWSSNGVVYQYDGTAGSLKNSYSAGIGPNGVLFLK